MFCHRKPMVWLFAGALVSGCGGDGSSSSGGTPSSGTSSGEVTVSITDAPVEDVTQVFVTFDAITFKRADEEEGEAETITLDAPIQVELTALTGENVAPLVEDQSLAAGEYDWLRLRVIEGGTDTYAVLDDSSQVPLTIPSNAQTGLKVVRGFTVPQSGNLSVTLDFDLRKSLVRRGNNNDLRLKPVLRMVQDDQVGVVSGTVNSTSLSGWCADVQTFAGFVYLFEGADQTPDDLGSNDEPLVTASVEFDEDDAAYEFSIAFLEGGNYTLAFHCQDGADDPEDDDDLTFDDIQNVTVTEGETTQVLIPAS